MTLDAQVGDQYDASTTNVHIIELHGTTAVWILGFMGLLIAVAAGMWWYCRRRYRQKNQRRGRQLALRYEGCTCGAAASGEAARPDIEERHRPHYGGRPAHSSSIAVT